MPGWQETIFPPYFVVGAMFSGFAMVVTLARADPLGPEPAAAHHDRHFDAMAKFLLLASLIMVASYRDRVVHGLVWRFETPSAPSVAFMFTGDYAPLYWAMLACNCLIPQALWLRPVRRTPHAGLRHRAS